MTSCPVSYPSLGRTGRAYVKTVLTARGNGRQATSKRELREFFAATTVPENRAPLELVRSLAQREFDPGPAPGPCNRLQLGSSGRGPSTTPDDRSFRDTEALHRGLERSVVSLTPISDLLRIGDGRTSKTGLAAMRAASRGE